MKLNFLLLVIVLTCGTNSLSQSNFQAISGKELETYIFQNHQAGKAGFENLYTKMVIEVEDYALLKNNFDELATMFQTVFTTSIFELDDINKRLIVVFEKKIAKTDDFLKVFKETLLQKQVLLYLYEESVLLKI